MSYRRGRFPIRAGAIAKYTEDLEADLLEISDLKCLWHFDQDIPDVTNKVIPNLVAGGLPLVEHTAYSNLQIVDDHLPGNGTMTKAGFLNGNTLLQADVWPTDPAAGWTLFGTILIADSVRALTSEANTKRARLVAGTSLSQSSHYIEVFRSGVRSVCGPAGSGGVSTPEYPPYHFPVGAWWTFAQTWDPVTKVTGFTVNRGTPVYSPAGTSQVTSATATLRLGGTSGPDSQHYMGPCGLFWGTGSEHSLLHPSRKAHLELLRRYLEMKIGARQVSWA